jgi:hypothetical protein
MTLRLNPRKQAAVRVGLCSSLHCESSSTFVGTTCPQASPPRSGPVSSRLKRLCCSTGAAILVCGLLSLPVNPVPTISAAGKGRLGTENNGRKTVSLIIHATDRDGNPVPPPSLKGVEVTGQGEKLQVVDGPKSAGPKQIAVLIDSNFHQRKVLPLEQKTAVELISEFEKEKAQGLVMSYGAEIHFSGDLTDDWVSLRVFTDSVRVEADKHNKTVLLYDAMKRALKNLGDGPGTKAVVIFAEGNDYGSSVGWKSLIRLAHRAHIACYVVLFADHSFYGTKAIRHYGWNLVFEVAPKTGGKLWEVGDKSRKAHEAAQQLISALDSQGLVEVRVPDVHLNRFHPVKVSSHDYRVSAQTGYFDDAIQ